MSDTIRVAVADDHPMFRAGVVMSLLLPLLDVSSVLRKLQLSSRHELARWASDRRIV